MVEFLTVYIYTIVWITVLGVSVFLGVYLSTRPWQTPMGRHILVFMAALGVAFAYALIAPHLSLVPRLFGWAISITAVAVTIWWRTGMIVRYQRKARQEEGVAHED